MQNIDHYPVHSEYQPDGWETTGIDYSDFKRMGTQTHKQSGERRLPTPVWALNNDLLQELLVRFFERRTYMRSVQVFPCEGTLQERLTKAVEQFKSQRAWRTTTIDGLCAAYVNAEAGARKKLLAMQIEIMDTFLSYTGDESCGLATIAAIPTLYYRVRLDSVGVGLELNLKPVHVRQTLARLHIVAKELAETNPRFAEVVEGETLAAYGKYWDRTRRTIKKLKPGAKLFYRGQPVELVKDGKLARIKNAKGETLTVERRMLENVQ